MASQSRALTHCEGDDVVPRFEFHPGVAAELIDDILFAVDHVGRWSASTLVRPGTATALHRGVVEGLTSRRLRR